MSDLHAKLAKQKQLDWLFVNATRLFCVYRAVVVRWYLNLTIFGALPSMKAFGINFYTSKDWDTGMDVYGALTNLWYVGDFCHCYFDCGASKFWYCHVLTELCPNF